jgi:hypothetical protein
MEIEQVGGTRRLLGSLPDRRSVTRYLSRSPGEVSGDATFPKREEELAILDIRMLTYDAVARVKGWHALSMCNPRGRRDEGAECSLGSMG